MKMMYSPDISKVSVYLMIMFIQYHVVQIFILPVLLYIISIILLCEEVFINYLVSMSPSYINWNSRHQYFTNSTTAPLCTVSYTFHIYIPTYKHIIQAAIYDEISIEMMVGINCRQQQIYSLQIQLLDRQRLL